MSDPRVVRLDETERVSFGPLSHYQPIIGDEQGSTPLRTGIQTAQPGYVAPVHAHPYLEVLHILDGTAEAWIDGQEDRAVLLRKGDTIALPPHTPHSFRVVGDQEPERVERHPRRDAAPRAAHREARHDHRQPEGEPVQHQAARQRVAVAVGLDERVAAGRARREGGEQEHGAESGGGERPQPATAARTPRPHRERGEHEETAHPQEEREPDDEEPGHAVAGRSSSGSTRSA